MAFEDTGIRVTVLGVAAFRRSTAALRNDMTSLNNSLSSAGGATAGFGAKLNSLSAGLVSLGRSLTTFVTVPITIAAAQIVGAGASFEQAFAGVTKTVDGTVVSFDEAADSIGLFGSYFTDAQKDMVFASDAFGQLTAEGLELRDGLRAMALEIPVSVNELARIGQLGGQLGVPRDQLLGFIETIALLGVSTDLSTDEAAESFAKLGNIMGVEASELSDWTFAMGNALVQLGNNFAAREPQILSMTMRLAAAGSQAGFTTEDLLGIATALAAMGIPAELGGTAVSRMFTQMSDAAATFKLGEVNDQLAEMSRLTGLTNEEMVNFINTDPNGAFLAIVNALALLNDEGTFTSSILADMEVGGVRALAVFQALTGNTDLLTDAQRQANEASEKGIALQSEAEIFFGTLNNVVILLKNAFNDLGIEIFDMYNSDLKNLVTEISNTITKFKEMNPETLKSIVRFLLIAAAVGPIVTALGLLGQAIAQLWIGFSFLMHPIKLVIGLLGGMISAPVLIALAVFGGLVVAVKENLFGLGDTFSLVWSMFTIGLATLKYQMGRFGFSVEELAKAFIALDFGAVMDELQQAMDGIIFFFKYNAKPIFEGFWPSIRTNFESNILQMVTWLNEQLPQLQKWGTDALDDLSGWAADLWALLQPKLTDWGTQIITFLTDKAVELGKKLVEEWIPAFADWALNLWQKVNGPLGDLTNDILVWIAEQTGILLDKFVTEWVPSFIDWIGPMIGDAILKLDEFILTSLLPWIMNQVTTISDKFLSEWLPAFIEWFGPMIEQFLSKLGEWLGSLTGWLLFTALPRIVIAVGMLAVAMVNWVILAIPQLLVAMGEFMVALIRFIIFDLAPGVGSFIWNFGKAFVNQMFLGLQSVWGGGEKMNEIRDQIQKKITEFTSTVGQNMYDFGAAIVQKLIDGIRDFANRIGLDTGLKVLSDALGFVGMDAKPINDLYDWLQGTSSSAAAATAPSAIYDVDPAAAQYNQARPFGVRPWSPYAAKDAFSNPDTADTFGAMGIVKPVPSAISPGGGGVINNNTSNTWNPIINNPQPRAAEEDLMTLQRRVQ